jgi:purine-cytosine permease-like protein
MVVSSFAIGALATPVFFLGFVDSVLTIFFFNILGILPVAFFSTFGPVFGLRQMVLSRFFYGFYGVKISACFCLSYFDFVLTNIFSCCVQHPCMHWLVLC